MHHGASQQIWESRLACKRIMDASKHSTLRQQRTVCRGARPRLLTTCSWPNRLAGEETCGALPGSVDLHIGQSILGTGASQCPLKVHVMQPFMTSPGMEGVSARSGPFRARIVFFLRNLQQRSRRLPGLRRPGRCPVRPVLKRPCVGRFREWDSHITRYS